MCVCSNEEFREAVERQEGEDARRLQERMQRSLDATECSRCGVSRLRTFLEDVLRQRYLDSVPQMLPLLDKEFRKVVRAHRICNSAQPYLRYRVLLSAYMHRVSNQGT